MSSNFTPSRTVLRYQLNSLDTTIEKHIETAERVNFIQFNVNGREYDGHKYTIVGETTQDAKQLCELLGAYLISIGCPFKVATHNLINRTDTEQAFKLMTIYVCKGTDSDLLLDDIKHFLKPYKGGQNVKLTNSEKIEGSIYRRNDLDLNGNYFPAGNPYNQPINQNVSVDRVTK